MLGIVTESAELTAAVDQSGDYICSETLTSQLSRDAIAGIAPLSIDVAGYPAVLYVKVVAATC